MAGEQLMSHGIEIHGGERTEESKVTQRGDEGARPEAKDAYRAGRGEDLDQDGEDVKDAVGGAGLMAEFAEDGPVLEKLKPTGNASDTGCCRHGNRKSRASPAPSEHWKPGSSGLESTGSISRPVAASTSRTRAGSASKTRVGHAVWA